MSSSPPLAPTLALLASVLPRYGEFSFDRTLEAARNDIGDDPDLANPEHAKRLRKWLNDWLCRIAYPTSQADVFANSLAAWWPAVKDTLPPRGDGLAQLTNAQLRAISDAYAGMCVLQAAVSKTGVRRGIGPTATAKLLYFIRPDAVTAWDKMISARTGGGHDAAAFLRHLTLCRSWAAGLEAEGEQRGLTPAEIGPSIGRPTSSVAKLIDEWLYATITGGLGTDRKDIGHRQLSEQRNRADPGRPLTS